MNLDYNALEVRDKEKHLIENFTFSMLEREEERKMLIKSTFNNEDKNKKKKKRKIMKPKRGNVVGSCLVFIVK